MRDLASLAPACSAALLFAASTTAIAQDAGRTDYYPIELGKSVVVDLPRQPKTVALTDPTVAGLQQLSGTRFQLQGLNLGTTDLVVQYDNSIEPQSYEISVQRDLSDLIRRISSIVEGEPPRVYPLEERIVVEGEVDDLDTLEQVALVSRLYDDDFVNLMSVRGDHQVQLEVLFAEVSRSGLRQLGFNVLADYQGRITGSLVGPTNNQTTHWFAVPAAAEKAHDGRIGVPGLSGFDLGIALATGGVQAAAIMDVLDDYKLGKILAQPTLVSLSGQHAEFLAGGELPVPAPSQQGQISIEYKPYGIQLVFVPTVLAGNVVDVRVQVEVSELDSSNSTKITGIEVPGFITRKAKGHLRIESGMTFAMAGMLSDTMAYSRAGIPGLGRIPVIGTLFRATSHYREETEVLIFVTPRLVRPLAAGELPAAPGTTENNNPSDVELFLLGLDHRPGSRTASPTGAVGLQR